jgi:hypothetical protein
LHHSVPEVLKRIRKESPGVPLLALGQTVFWDEPLKALLPILSEEAGEDIRLVAGVHDTDYFAKLPGGLPSGDKPFVALPKNDGSTKDFWSAAGEFSALFGSETPITRETLAEAGVSLDRISNNGDDTLDKATEAWGWRGVASADPVARVTSEVPIHRAFEELQATFAWALKASRDCLETAGDETDEVISELMAMVCAARDGCPGQTLAEFYECLLPRLHRFVTGRKITAEITRTGKLLSFDGSTCGLPRFRFAELFIAPETSEIANRAYDAAVRHTEVYTLDRFGTGAIPFDLVIPGQGRGTIRLTSKMLIVMTPEPKFVKLLKPVASIKDLAYVTEKAFGKCVLVGKAITLIGMLAAEFMFAFHEGASMYVEQTRKLIRALTDSGINVTANPILRISLGALDALDAVDCWFRLPEPLRGPYGADVVSAATIASSWKCVGEQQALHKRVLSQARNITLLLDALQKIRGGRWERLSEEYSRLRLVIAPMEEKIRGLDARISTAYTRLRRLKQEWQTLETKRGEAFRADRHDQRHSLGDAISVLRVERRGIIEQIRELRREKAFEASAEAIRNARERRKTIEREAELGRLRTVREAVVASVGMEKSNRRPAAWWLPLATPDGSWFDSLKSQVQLRLESLQ